MNRTNKRIFAALIVATFVAPCWGQEQIDKAFSIGGYHDVDFGQFAELDVLYWPDEHAGVGVMVLDGFAGVTLDNPAVGASVKFMLGGPIQAGLDALTSWLLGMAEAPARTFLKMGLPRDFEHDVWIFVTGPGLQFFPDWAISPEVCYEIIVPEGNSPDPQSQRLMLGAVWKF